MSDGYDMDLPEDINKYVDFVSNMAFLAAGFVLKKTGLLKDAHMAGFQATLFTVCLPFLNMGFFWRATLDIGLLKVMGSSFVTCILVCAIATFFGRYTRRTRRGFYLMAVTGQAVSYVYPVVMRNPKFGIAAVPAIIMWDLGGNMFIGIVYQGMVAEAYALKGRRSSVKGQGRQSRALRATLTMPRGCADGFMATSAAEAAAPTQVMDEDSDDSDDFAAQKGGKKESTETGVERRGDGFAEPGSKPACGGDGYAMVALGSDGGFAGNRARPSVGSVDADGFAKEGDHDADGFAKEGDHDADGFAKEGDHDADGFAKEGDGDGDGFAKEGDGDGDGLAKDGDDDADGFTKTAPAPDVGLDQCEAAPDQHPSLSAESVQGTKTSTSSRMSLLRERVSSYLEAYEFVHQVSEWGEVAIVRCKQLGIMLLRTPLLWGVFMGFVLNVTNVPFTPLPGRALRAITSAFPPLLYTLLGANLRFQLSRQSFGTVVRALLCRWVINFLCILWIQFVLPLGDFHKRILVLFILCPMTTTAVMYGNLYGYKMDQVSVAKNLSDAASLVALAVVSIFG